MASNRHLGRIIALQTLYEQEFRIDCQDNAFKLEKVLTRNINRYRDMVEDQKFVSDLVYGVVDNLEKLDRIIQPVAPEWPISQIARMDRIILRIATYELVCSDKVPPKVVINEAVELAKSFGGENTSKFVNGVLGTILKGKDNKSNKSADKSGARKVKKS